MHKEAVAVEVYIVSFLLSHWVYYLKGSVREVVKQGFFNYTSSKQTDKANKAGYQITQA